jgi:hypothetical protein
MTPLILASAMALFRATLSSPDPLFPTDGPGSGPLPVNGIWAGLPADCATPTSLDLSTWPKCATPVGFLDGQIAVLQKPRAGSTVPPDQYVSVARTKFWTAKQSAGAPEIVQVDVPILFNHATIYIAVQPDAVDEAGRFVSAVGWPVGCPPAAVAGISNDNGRCVAMTADSVRAAAAIVPSPDKTYRLVRINASIASPLSPAAGQTPTTDQAPDTDTSAAPPPLQAAPPSTPPTAAPGQVIETPLPAPTPPPTPTPQS